MKAETLGIYIHIPFCKSKCDYCDFNSGPELLAEVEQYVDFLSREIDLYRDIISESRLETIFIGGGTPTAIDPEHVGRILGEIFALNKGDGDIELTIEGNPDDYTPERTSRYLDMGINRFSMGVQSFDPRKLDLIGRRVPKKSIVEIVEGMRGAGAKNISMDLMFGLPEQTIEESIQDVEKAISLGLEHISLYGLKLEEATALYKRESDGELELPSEEDEREMYHKAISRLKQGGYCQYEISNFALADRESRHNLRYWQLKPYIGLGLSASSNIGKRRYKNVDGLSDYLQMLDLGSKPIDRDSVEEISQAMEMAEYMILGLRLNQGVAISDFIKSFAKDPRELYGQVLEKHIKSGMLLIEGDKIKLTQKGIDLSNQIFYEILPD